MSNSLSLSTTDGTKWTSFKYDWGIWKKAEPEAIMDTNGNHLMTYCFEWAVFVENHWKIV